MFFNFFQYISIFLDLIYIFENTVSEEKFKSRTVKLLVQYPENKLYPKFVKYRLYFNHYTRGSI